MEFNPKVSIIIPVYNGSNYLREAIDSALAQTYKNIEVIVVNDGSNDRGKTEKIAVSYDNRIRYFFKENGGVASALNFGIRQMTGEFFSWLSHDDVYLPYKVEVQIRFLQNDVNNVVLYGDYYLIDSKSRLKGLHKFQQASVEYFTRELITSFPVNGCTVLIPKACFDDVGYFNEQLRTTQDYEMWIRLSRKYKFIHIPKCLINSRRHHEQGTHKFYDVQLAEANTFYIWCLNMFSADDFIKSHEKTKTRYYLNLGVNFKSRGFDAASEYAFELASENLGGSNLFAQYYEQMLLIFFKIIPRKLLINYWRLILRHLNARIL